MHDSLPGYPVSNKGAGNKSGRVVAQRLSPDEKGSAHSVLPLEVRDEAFLTAAATRDSQESR